MADKIIAQRDYDDAVSAQQIAQADIKTAQAQVRQARLKLSYTHVDAPISGIVVRAQTQGTLVSGTDVLLATITQIQPADVLTLGYLMPNSKSSVRSVPMAHLNYPLMAAISQR